HLLFIGFPPYSENEILFRQRLQGSLGNDVFAGLQNGSGESAQKKSKRFLLRFPIGKSDDNHELSFTLPKNIKRDLLLRILALGTSPLPPQNSRGSGWVKHIPPQMLEARTT